MRITLADESFVGTPLAVKAWLKARHARAAKHGFTLTDGKLKHVVDPFTGDTAYYVVSYRGKVHYDGRKIDFTVRRGFGRMLAQYLSINAPSAVIRAVQA